LMTCKTMQSLKIFQPCSLLWNNPSTCMHCGAALCSLAGCPWVAVVLKEHIEVFFFRRNWWQTIQVWPYFWINEGNGILKCLSLNQYGCSLYISGEVSTFATELQTYHSSSKYIPKNLQEIECLTFLSTILLI
jgi:hypothetical protein